MPGQDCVVAAPSLSSKDRDEQIRHLMVHCHHVACLYVSPRNKEGVFVNSSVEFELYALNRRISVDCPTDTSSCHRSMYVKRTACHLWHVIRLAVHWPIKRLRQRARGGQLMCYCQQCFPLHNPTLDYLHNYLCWISLPNPFIDVFLSSSSKEAERHESHIHEINYPDLGVAF